jgi:(p)ppGpp synthase/HD superfamily hydrolase
MTPEKAKEIMRQAHAGQVDKAGMPYHWHPERVADRLQDAPAYVRVAAYLHDVLEDTALTSRDLFEQGMELRSGVLIDIVTRRPSESYHAFIQRIAASGMRWAIRIKLADLEDNMSRPLPKEHEWLHRRYERAKTALTRTLAGMDSA